MTAIEPLISTETERRGDAARKLREERRRLVKPDATSRPTFTLGARTVRPPEWLFRVPLATVWAIVVGLLVAEAFRAGATSVMYGHVVGAALILAAALLSMLVVFADLASYRPRLFVLADRSGTALIDAFVAQSGDFEAVASEFRNTPLRRWAQVPRRQEQVLSATDQYVRLGGLRARIAVRTLHRLAILIAALGLVAYALSALTGGEVMSEAARTAGVAEHLYFVVAQFLTIGFGDIHPHHGPWGYTFMVLSTVTMAAVVYFVLAEIVASQAQFRTDLRAAVERYVLSNTKV